MPEFTDNYKQQMALELNEHKNKVLKYIKTINDREEEVQKGLTHLESVLKQLKDLKSVKTVEEKLDALIAIEIKAVSYHIDEGKGKMAQLNINREQSYSVIGEIADLQ